MLMLLLNSLFLCEILNTCEKLIFPIINDVVFSSFHKNKYFRSQMYVVTLRGKRDGFMNRYYLVRERV